MRRFGIARRSGGKGKKRKKGKGARKQINLQKSCVKGLKKHKTTEQEAGGVWEEEKP